MAAVVIDTDDFVELLKAAQVTTFTGKDDPVMRCEIGRASCRERVCMFV